MTCASKPARRVTPFGTIAGSNVPSRSRGTANVTEPSSVSTVFAVCPLRLLAPRRPERSPVS
jgi:hypothetical protein